MSQQKRLPSQVQILQIKMHMSDLLLKIEVLYILLNLISASSFQSCCTYIIIIKVSGVSIQYLITFKQRN